MDESRIVTEAAAYAFDWKALTLWLMAAVISLLTYIRGQDQKDVARHGKEIDAHETRIESLEMQTVRQGDIAALRGEIKRDLNDMEGRLSATVHTGLSHVAERIGDVKASAEAANRRIDAIILKAPH